MSVLNRTVTVNPDGSWLLPNIPANFGPVRARATCVNNGVVQFGQSAFITLPANGSVNVPAITLGSVTPIPASIAITSPTTSLTAAGQTVQLTVTASYASGNPADVTAASAGTIYNVSNPAIATVSANGLVTAVSSGPVVIQAVNEGRQGMISLQIVISNSSHGGIPDSWAIAHGLDPNDPGMPYEDPDHDGLTNLQEFQNGTDPLNPDTDGDGLTDGQEVLQYHTNPTLFSTDGTGISDGIEVQTGTLGSSFSSKLHAALSSLQVTPSTFTLDVNAIQGQASQQLQVLGHLIDGKTVLDLTSTSEGTSYSSSNLTICNFGTPDGNIFAGSNGNCTITVSNNGFTAQANGTVTSFSPTPLSFVPIPGFANGLDINGNHAYVAAGASGLQVVDVTDRTNPNVVGSLPLPGNANGVRLLGNFAFVAAGSAGLQMVDISNPTAPMLKGSLATNGNALNVAVRGTTAYVANGSNLFIADVTTPTNMTQIVALSLNGTIQGIDVDAQRGLAVVTAGTNGIYVVDVSNPGAPVVLGTTTTGNARAVSIQGNYAFVADFQNSTVSVDISNPASPVVVSNITDPNVGGFLQDIAVSGNFALGADVFFFNGIPITDISTPTSLVARSILNFPQRDDNGMAIAVDATYAYLATEHSSTTKFGTTGDSRMYIGQYLALSDTKGVAPIAAITSPQPSSTAIESQVLPITVNASDDVAVAAVNFLVNGQVVFTSTARPYQFNLTVPQTLGPLTIGATAVDLAGNVGTAQTVTISVISDPGTTVTGVVTFPNHAPAAGATVTVSGGASTTTLSDGSFSIAGVATVSGYITASATIAANSYLWQGTSNNFVPVRGGTTNVGTITVNQITTGTVSGVVTIGQVAGVGVRMDLYNNFQTYLTVYTDTTGSYTFGNVPIGTYILNATAPTGAAGSAFVTVGSGTTSTKNFSLAGSSAVTVQVNRANGTPVSGAYTFLINSGTEFYGFTDSSGQIVFANVAQGPFTVKVYGFGGQVGGPQSAQAQGQVATAGTPVNVTLAFVPMGTITGTVTHPDGTPSVGSYVFLYGSGGGAQTDSTGHYAITNVGTNQNFTIYVVPPRGLTIASSVTNTIITADAQVVTVNLVLPAIATLQVSTFNSDGSPATGVDLFLQAPDLLSGTLNTWVVYNSSGPVNIAGVWGNYTVTAYDGKSNNTFSASATGSVTAANDGQVVNVVLTLPANTIGNIQGHVYAADGHTGVPYASVSVQDTGTGGFVGGGTTALDGSYIVSNVKTGPQGFTVTATAPSNYQVTTSSSGSFTSNNQSISRDLTLPLAVVTGSVAYHDGTPVPFPQVFLSQTDSSGNSRTYFEYNGSAGDGTFTLIGGVNGAFTISAQDPASALAGSYTGTILDFTQPVNVNTITLQPSGTVTGSVVDELGNPYPYPYLALTSSGHPDYTSIYASGDSGGIFQFDHVPLGNFSVQAGMYRRGWDGIMSAGSGTVKTAGDTETLNLAFPATQTVFGTVLRSDGSTPDLLAYIEAESLDSSGPLDHFVAYGKSDVAGNYIFAGLPARNERLSTLSADLSAQGFAMVNAGSLVQLNVQEGNGTSATSAIFNMDGSDGFQYDVGCDGTVYNGGTVNRNLVAFRYGFSLAVNNNFFQCPFFNDFLPPNPTTTGSVGPEGLGGVQLTRKVFSPSSGGFVRYLEELTNSTSTALTITVKVESVLGNTSGLTTRIVTDPASDGNTYAIVDNNGQCCVPALGFVFAGPGAAVPVATTYFVNQDNTVSYTWNVPIPAGQTVILMHFGVQKAVTDDAGATAQAQSLVNLSDPNALVGMTPAEQSEVVNFVVP